MHTLLSRIIKFNERSAKRFTVIKLGNYGNIIYAVYTKNVFKNFKTR